MCAQYFVIEYESTLGKLALLPSHSNAGRSNAGHSSKFTVMSSRNSIPCVSLGVSLHYTTGFKEKLEIVLYGLSIVKDQLINFHTALCIVKRN